MWGGSRTYSITANASLISAFDNFAHNAPSDPDAAVLLIFFYYNSTFLSSTDIQYARPMVNPPIFHGITAIESFASTMRITNLTGLVLEFEEANPSGFRETYFTATVKPDAALEKEILDIFISEVETFKDAENVLPAIVLQHITTNTISHFYKNGGNALGISESDGPLLCKRPSSISHSSLQSHHHSLTHITSTRPLHILELSFLRRGHSSRRRQLHQPMHHCR